MAYSGTNFTVLFRTCFFCKTGFKAIFYFTSLISIKQFTGCIVFSIFYKKSGGFLPAAASALYFFVISFTFLSERNILFPWRASIESP